MNKITNRYRLGPYFRKDAGGKLHYYYLHATGYVEENTPYCDYCNGTGEGAIPEIACSHCNGSGVKVKPKGEGNRQSNIIFKR